MKASLRLRYRTSPGIGGTIGEAPVAIIALSNLTVRSPCLQQGIKPKSKYVTRAQHRIAGADQRRSTTGETKIINNK